MSFWESFDEATKVAIETMGESVQVGEVPDVRAIVENFTTEEGAAPGGRKTGLTCALVLPKEVEVQEGMRVTVRGVQGKIESWDMISGDTRKVYVGPHNRWSGTVPGL